MYHSSCTYIARAGWREARRRKQMDNQWQVEVATHAQMNNYDDLRQMYLCKGQHVFDKIANSICLKTEEEEQIDDHLQVELVKRQKKKTNW